MSSNVLSTKDANLALSGSANTAASVEGKDVKSMEYHRQVLQSKMEEEKYDPFSCSVYSTTTATISRPPTPYFSSPPKKPLMSVPAREPEDEENNYYVLSSQAAPADESQPVIVPIPGRGGSTNSGGAASSNNTRLNSRTDIVLLRERQKQQYISPSDNIMSPCTAKLNALRSKHAGKAKPKSLFAQTSSKRLEGDALFGSKPATKEPET